MKRELHHVEYGTRELDDELLEHREMPLNINIQVIFPFWKLDKSIKYHIFSKILNIQESTFFNGYRNQ